MSHFVPWPYPRVLAHRGGGTLAPENTIAGIEAGRRYGFRAIECDAMLAADGVPVLMHDSTLDRTTDGRGPVAARTSAELARLDAGRWRGPEFAGTPVPTLAEAIRHCRRHGIWMNIEIKPSGAEAEQDTGATVARVAAGAYADCLRADGDRAQSVVVAAPLLSSFSERALAAARAAAPGLPRGLLVEAIPSDWQERLQASGAVALHCDHRRLTEAEARRVKSAGYWLFCYTVNDPQRVRDLFAWGVDALCTDRIDLVRPEP